jgi:hypothetical protein
MKITDLLSKPAVVQLKDVVSGEALPVHVKIKPAEDKIVKEAIRHALVNAPTPPGENATDVDKLAYIDAMDKTERVILAARVISVEGLEDLSQTPEAIEAFVLSLPAEYIAQIQEAIADRKAFFRQSW